MNSENEILAEIHRHRAEHAKECGYDVSTMFAQMRDEQKHLEAAGWKVVTLAPRKTSTTLDMEESDSTCVLREEPPKP